jgi:hypothetical protein
MAYEGHMDGIARTGMSQNRKDLRFLVRVSKIKLKSGIKAKEGIFVKIDKPRKIPERKTNIMSLLEGVALFSFCLTERAKSTEHRRNGNNKLSRSILLSNQPNGITANKVAAINAIVLL